MKILARPSPNFGARPKGNISALVLHYTGMKSAQEALARLCDPLSEVSAHYFITEAGEITELVDPNKRAWHAGISSWRGRSNVNDFSIGIELVNPGHDYGYRPFPDDQIRALLWLLGILYERYPLQQKDIIGHSDIAPGRKCDPGELFPWHKLAGAGFGLWYNSHNRRDLDDISIKSLNQSDKVDFKHKLEDIGYGFSPCTAPSFSGGSMDVSDDDLAHNTEFMSVIRAFQRRWRQSSVTGILDAGTITSIDAIHKLYMI